MLDSSQYGGCPGRQAIIPAIININLRDYSHMRVLPTAGCYKDAASCYDRLVEPFANLCMASIGMHEDHLALHSEVH